MNKKHEPLFGCDSLCEIAHPADELRIHDGDLICQDCWEEYRNFDSEAEYTDLPAFVPEADLKIQALTDGLQAIKQHLEIMGAGRLSAAWNIADTALAKAEAIGK